jgi:Flp pilus assembly protein TadB
MNDSLIPYLFGVTFALAIVYAAYQWWRAKKARDEHHRSASARANGEPRKPSGQAPGDAPRR